MNKFGIGGVLTALILIGGVICAFASTTTVKAGYAGVVYNANGGIEQKALDQGWHVIAPWKSVTEYPVSTEPVYLTKSSTEGSKNDDSFNVSTKEGKPVNVDVMYSFHMEQDKLPHIFTKFKGASADTIEKGFIKQSIKGIIQEVTSQYAVMDLYGEKRGEITKKIEDTLNSKGSVLHEDGIVIETFAFGEIRPDENSMKAIQAKVDAQQKLQQLEIEKQQSSVQADQARIKAQGEADAKLIQAQGEAKANKEKQLSLTPELIEYLKVQQWDGKNPTTVLGNGTSTLVQVK